MIYIYTDGGCSGNPGPGGWAYMVIGTWEPVLLAENWGAEKSTTNNRMELKAVISALEALPGICPEASAGAEKITVYTDSQYVQKGITIWIKDWKGKGWKTSAKDPVKNQDLWKRLDALAAGFSINWVWVKGHAGNEYNERCDALTQKAIASL
jgi:ribonuclease HI